MKTGHRSRTLLLMIGETIDELAAILRDGNAPRQELDAADKVAWMLRHLKKELEQDLLRANYVAIEVVNGTESIGLGRLERWQETGFCPKLSTLYGFCLGFEERSGSRKGST